MTAPYQPPPPRSARTIGWAIGRGIVWLVYAFVVFAINRSAIGPRNLA